MHLRLSRDHLSDPSGPPWDASGTPWDPPEHSGRQGLAPERLNEMLSVDNKSANNTRSPQQIERPGGMRGAVESKLIGKHMSDMGL